MTNGFGSGTPVDGFTLFERLHGPTVGGSEVRTKREEIYTFLPQCRLTRNADFVPAYLLVEVGGVPSEDKDLIFKKH